MPSVTIKHDAEVEVDIEVYCGTCGEGICSDSKVELRRNWGECVRVTATCKNCVKECDELKLRIDELEQQLADKE